MNLCWRNIWQSICFRSTLCLPLKGPEKMTNSSRTGEQMAVVSTECTVVHCFTQPWSLKVCLSPGSGLTSSLHLTLSRNYSGSIWRFHFSGKGLVLHASIHLALRSDLEIRLLQPKLGENASGPIPEEVVSNKTVQVQPSAYSFETAVFQRVTFKNTLGNTCTPMADSCDCTAKPPQYCKVNSL